MSSNPYGTYSTRETTQLEPIPGKKMVKNSDSGFVFKIDDWKRLERFLILGNEGGTYYASEQKLTRENGDCVLRCIKVDGIRTVKTIVDISDSGRAPKNNPALFALAMCAGLGDNETKKCALAFLPLVARIGTDLFNFVAYVEQFRGWGRSLKRGIQDWYKNKTIDKLAYQVVKYQSRDGWSHRDLLRLSHPSADKFVDAITEEGEKRNSIYAWITKNKPTDSVKLIEGYELAKSYGKEPKPKLIAEYGLTREMIPTEWLNNVDVWAALLEKMPPTAMIRNLGKMTNVGLLKPLSHAARLIVDKLSNIETLKKARIHPFSVLTALKIYEQGHGDKGKLSWDPVSQIVDALDKAFYSTFQNVEPTNKRWLLGLDVSGSMTWDSIAGLPFDSREASAAMALITASTEKQHHIMGFSGFFIPLSISPRQRMDDVLRRISNLPFSSTNCAIPMVWAIENKINVDVFVIYTDNQTNVDQIHPCLALEKYRQKTGIPAKLIVVGMTATSFSIADPDDGGMMECVGFDTAIPQIMNDFVGYKNSK